VKAKSKKTAINDSIIDRKSERKFDAATEWTNHLIRSPRYHGVLDAFADDPYCAALRSSGSSFLSVVVRLAKAGHSQAIRNVVIHACEMVDALEEIAVRNSETLQEMAARRADWPVMLCRHETSNKIVSTYLDKIGLGTNCAINADGQRLAKYSLRTPINRFVWRKLKRLPSSIELLSDVPGIAAIDLSALPKLTKANAKVWADKALMPYITAMHENFSEVPELSAILARRGVRTRGEQRREIRKDVIRALQCLAPSS
jgi:hypothetical protein